MNEFSQHEQRTLRESAEAVLAAGELSGDFSPMDLQLRLSTMGGALLAMLHLMLRDPERRTEEAVDAVAVALLRFLGVADERAEAAVAAPLPETDPFTL